MEKPIKLIANGTEAEITETHTHKKTICKDIN